MANDKKNNKDTVMKFSKGMEKTLNSKGKLSDEREWGIAGFSDGDSDEDLVGDFDDYLGVSKPGKGKDVASMQAPAKPQIKGIEDRVAQADNQMGKGVNYSNLKSATQKGYAAEAEIESIRTVDENLKPASFKNVKDENETAFADGNKLEDTLELELKNFSGKAGAIPTVGVNAKLTNMDKQELNANEKMKMISDFGDDESEENAGPKEKADKSKLDEWKEQARQKKMDRDFGDGF